MLIPHCDRCRTANVQIVPVLGVDLCNACVTEFRVWVQTADHVDGTTEPALTRRRTPTGQPYRVARLLVEETGEVTPHSYGRVTSKCYRSAYYSLYYLVRCGLLVRVARQDKSVAFALARAEAAE